MNNKDAIKALVIVLIGALTLTAYISKDVVPKRPTKIKYVFIDNEPPAQKLKRKLQEKIEYEHKRDSLFKEIEKAWQIEGNNE